MGSIKMGIAIRRLRHLSQTWDGIVTWSFEGWMDWTASGVGDDRCAEFVHVDDLLIWLVISCMDGVK